MLYLQLQGNPCDALLGWVIQASAYQEQASAKGEGYGYASSTSDPSVSPGRTPHQRGWGAQQKKSCGADRQFITYDGENYHHAAVMVSTLSSKISCKGWRRYQGLGHPWKEGKCMHILYMDLLTYIAYNTYPVFFFRFLSRCCFHTGTTRGSFSSYGKDAQYQTFAKWHYPMGRSREHELLGSWDQS